MRFVIIIWILFFSILTYKCCNQRTTADAFHEVHLKNYFVEIDEVREMKYTYIKCHFVYKGETYYTENTSGYYYKHYKFEAGNTVTADVDIYWYKNEDGTVTIQPQRIDFSKYVLDSEDREYKNKDCNCNK